MKNIPSANPAFREGDEVVLALGSYQGTLSVFLRLRGPQLGGHPRAQRRHPKSPGDLAGSLHQRHPRLRELTPP